MKIDVYDNFFSKEIQKEVWTLMQRPQWSFNGGRQDHSFWHMNDLEKEDYFSKFLFTLVRHKFTLKSFFANYQQKLMRTILTILHRG